MPGSRPSFPEIDLTDPDAFVAGVPHHWFRKLRREAPVRCRCRRPRRVRFRERIGGGAAPAGDRFGIGEHFCLGANLARLEIRVMFEEILRRLPDMQITGEVRRLRSTFIDGIEEIPVRFTPESHRGSRAA